MRSQAARKKLSATDARILRTLLLVSVFEPQAIGNRIAQAREEAGLRQEDLADLINLSTRSVQGYEAGTTNAYRHIRAISGVTGKSVEWLLHGDQQSEQPADDDKLNRLVGEVEEIRGMLERVLEARDDSAEPESEQASEAS